jgi:predicted nucleotidyltransferase
MTERDREIVARLRDRLSGDALAHLRRMIVFGSRARGDAAPDSDLDIAVIVEGATPGLENELEEAAYSVMWDMDFKPIISLKMFTEAQYRDALDKGYSFYRNIEREGVPV